MVAIKLQKTVIFHWLTDQAVLSLALSVTASGMGVLAMITAWRPFSRRGDGSYKECHRDIK